MQLRRTPRTADPTTRSLPHRRGTAAVGLSAVVLGTLSALASPASAALSGVGAIDPATNFPAYYTDSNGLSLELCLGLPNCLADTDFVAVHEAGGDAEAFYYAADASTTNFTVHLALEAAYAADGPNQEVVFQRTQLTARGGGLDPGTVYKITDPYGTYNCTVEDDGTISQNACRIETTPVEGDFNRALTGRQGPFLTVDPTEPAPPAGFIGDNVTPRKVIGSPTGFNAFRVEGPGLRGTCTNADGSVVNSCEQTDRFILQGKLADTGVPSASVSQGTLDFGDVPATPAVTKTLTYANTGLLPVTVSSIALGGTNASAFGQTNTCPVAPATLDAGARCSIDVTFTPQSGAASAATLTISDDTPAATRNIALKGSNLPTMYVSDPVPPLGLGFGTVPVGQTSVEDNAVIGNSGNGPLTIATTTITGTGAPHFKLGPNNTCRTQVAPDAGCEIGVQFVPTSTGSKTANLRVTDSNGKIVNVALTGTGGQPAPDTTRPSAPPALTGSVAGTTANLSWGAATDNVAVTGYRVLRNGTQVGTTPATTRTFTDANLAAGTHTYTVVAVDGAGNVSVASNAQALTVPDTAAPTAPNLSGSVTGTTANLSWTGATDNVAVTGYQVFRNNVQVGANLAATARSTSQANLAAGTYNYTVRAIDAAGNFRASNQVTLVVAAPNPAPTVSTRTPAINATSVAVANNITATFSEPVTGVTTGTFVIRPAATPASTPITGTVGPGAAANQWVLNPTANLVADTRYTVTLTGGATAIRDSAGAPLATTSWSFTTGPAPTITGRTPAINSTLIPRANNVTVTFSENVQAVSGTTFFLRVDGTTTNIAAAVTRNGTTNQWILNPSATLAANTLYRVTLTGGTTGIRDLAGNPMGTGQTLTWTFRTGA